MPSASMVGVDVRIARIVREGSGGTFTWTFRLVVSGLLIRADLG